MNYSLRRKAKTFKKVIGGIDHFNDEDVYILNVTEGSFMDYLKLTLFMLLPENKRRYDFRKRIYL